MELFRQLASRVISPRVLMPDRRAYATPAEFHLAATPIEARRRDGTLLRGHRFHASGEGSGSPLPVVFLPGNSANLSAHLLYVEMLVRAGCDVVALDYSGFGVSEGSAAVRRLLDDAHAACDAALRLSAATDTPGGDGRRAGKIGLFGLSIGANLSLALAACRRDIAAVALEGLSFQREMVRGILECGSPGPRELAEIRLDDDETLERESLAVSRLRLPRLLAAALSGIAAASYPFPARDPLEFLPRLADLPLLIIHGTGDPIFPVETALAAWQAQVGPGRLWLLPGTGHAQEPALRDDREYVAQLENFFHGAGARVSRATMPPADAEGAWLLAARRSGGLHLRRAWLRPGEPRPELPGEATRCPWGVKIFAARQRGETWRPLHSPRARLYRSRLEAPVRRLVHLLRHHDVDRAAAALEALAALDLEAPFDSYLRILAARLEDLAARRHGSIAGRAREVFSRGRRSHHPDHGDPHVLAR